MAVNLKDAYQEFQVLKTENVSRNYDYYLTRQAIANNFRWPRNWPVHIPKVKRNLCKRITRQHATYLMGKGFSYNISRPNTLEYRESAERSEKILRQLLRLSRAEVQFTMSALTGSQLGRSVWKVYKKGEKGRQHACFSYCQPDYFYGIPSGDNHASDYSVVYYSYPLDINEAKRIYGDHAYKTEDADDLKRYDRLVEDEAMNSVLRKRRVPVFEAWTKNDYALVVGGVSIFNGDNPYKWKETGEGFIPYVVVENSRNAGEALGEGDIAEARELNELYNQLLSMRWHHVKKWLRPTLVWEGAPQNYGETLTNALSDDGVGGAIPARLGSKLYFLGHDRPNPAVTELEQAIRLAIIESAGMSEMALQGTTTGSINTGPSLSAQFQPVLSAVESKQTEWTWGLQTLSAMLLELQEQIGDSKALGSAVINQDRKSKNDGDGELVELSGKDIKGLREVEISWPDILPQDDIANARLEIEKFHAGMQSLYTTLEKLGEQYPDDEIARIRFENQDPSLRGEKVAEQLRAQTPLLKAQMDQQTRTAEAHQKALANMAQMSSDANDFSGPEGQTPGPANDIASRIREIAKSSQARLDQSGDEPFVSAGAPQGY